MLRSSVSSDVSSEIWGRGRRGVEGDATSYQLNCLPHSARTLWSGGGRPPRPSLPVEVRQFVWC